MKGKRSARSENHDSDEGGERVVAENLEGQAVLGDVIWVKHCGNSWWPALVVDENNVSGSNKPAKRSKIRGNNVLVRLYGSYEYLYVDPVKCRSEFEIILKQSNGCYREIFRKALEQDLPHSKSGQSKGQGSNSKGASKERVGASKDKKSNQNQFNQEREASNLKSSKGNASSGKEGRPKDSARNVNSVRVSPRTQMNMLTPQRKMEDGDIISKVVEEAVNKASRQDGVKWELKLDSSDTEENSKRKTPKQDGVQKKLKGKCRSTDEQAKSKTLEQDRVRKRLGQNGSSMVSDTECQGLEQDDVLKKQELSPSSGGTFFGRLQELRARRTKVMQTLGLTAPSGSPFHKTDGCI